MRDDHVEKCAQPRAKCVVLDLGRQRLSESFGDHRSGGENGLLKIGPMDNRRNQPPRTLSLPARMKAIGSIDAGCEQGLDREAQRWSMSFRRIESSCALHSMANRKRHSRG